ncbi:MAG: nucleotidyltransferase domain-containing protein [bacterium]
MNELSLSSGQLKIVLSILKKYPYTFYAYGSRTQSRSRPSSDLDICFIEHIPLNIQSNIEEEFEESDLPFRVEISDYNLMTEEFRKLIKNDLIPIG